MCVYIYKDNQKTATTNKYVEKKKSQKSVGNNKILRKTQRNNLIHKYLKGIK